MDMMRKYRVSVSKEVLAVDENMARTIAAEHIRKEDEDGVTVVLLESSIADKVEGRDHRHKGKPCIGTYCRDARDYSESLADA